MNHLSSPLCVRLWNLRWPPLAAALATACGPGLASEGEATTSASTDDEFTSYDYDDSGFIGDGTPFYECGGSYGYSFDCSPFEECIDTHCQAVDVPLPQCPTAPEWIALDIPSPADEPLVLGFTNVDADPALELVTASSAGVRILDAEFGWGPGFDLPLAPTRLELVDLDGDQLDDLLVLDAGMLRLFRQVDGLGFEELPGWVATEAVSFAVGEFDGNAGVDLVVVVGLDLQLWTNDGQGTLVPGSTGPWGPGLSLATAAIDGDLIDDLVIASSDAPPVFKPMPFGEDQAIPFDFPRGGQPTTGDFDGDGVADLLMLIGREFSTSIRLWRGTGAALEVVSDSGAVAEWLYLARAGDIDGDGEVEVVFAGDKLGVLDDPFGRRCTTVFNLPGDYYRAVAIGDFDGDGSQEIAAINSTGLHIYGLP